MMSVCKGKFCDQIIRKPGGHLVCIHNNLTQTHPELCKQWYHELNELGPENYTYGSGVKVWWLCPYNQCGCHIYISEIKLRAKRGIATGCPYCDGKPCPHNNLTITHPNLVVEWSELNLFQPENYTYGSSLKVWWICKNNKCGCHVFESVISSRTGDQKIERGLGCPYCDGKPCLHNNLTITHPNLINQWDRSKNILEPENYTFGSGLKIWWLCEKNHSYDARINCRTNEKEPTGCPYCSTNGYSKSCVEWLNSIMTVENINIQHAENGGEHKIEKVKRVDGFCKETNTVYEYHGNYFHGHPSKHHPDDINEVNGLRFGDLYNKTLERDNLIRSLGYNLVIIWEHEYLELRKHNLLINRLNTPTNIHVINNKLPMKLKINW